MKLFVATIETQGRRSNDFCFVPEGEIVMFPVVECDGDDPDGPCGCHRDLCGIDTLTGTTTFKVADLPLTKVQFVELLADSLQAAGWFKTDAVECLKLAEEHATKILRTVGSSDIGDVVERRGECFNVRKVSVTAVPVRAPE